MLFTKKNGYEKREELRKLLKKGKLLRFPGSYSPLVSMLIEQKRFDGIYISGAVLSNDLGLPDIGLTSLQEVSSRGGVIANSCNLPGIIDIDTGFGETVNVARTVVELEQSGLAGCHLEDQILPKRCGHLDHKELVESKEMEKKIKAAVDARRDPNFLIIARTDARSSEKMAGAINRAKAYVDAGAEMIFPEALQNEKEFEQFRKEIKVPLLANMTEFGKSKLLDYQTLEKLGYNIVIYPVTTVRLAMKAVEDGLDHLLEHGGQEEILPKMQTRQRLYEILNYEKYNKFDKDIFNFKL
ncbi:MAG: methylisocitrate lyase [Halobacteriovoraceae bacterium]|nr:methylisocitrate lyase [Halobacteriovoraceae bacterium]